MAFIKDLFSSPDPPPPVDWGNIGEQQAAANIEAARVGAKLARPDVVTPYSTTTFRETAPDRYLAATTLEPEYEALRGGEAAIQTGLQRLAAGRMLDVPTSPFTTQGMTPEPGPFQYSTVAPQPEFSTAGATYALPGYEDLDAYTSNAANEFFNRATARLNPQFDRAKRALRTQLLTSGIPDNSDAYREEMRLFDQQRSDALSDLASQSVFQGQTLQSNMIANILAGRGQQLGEIATEYDVAQRRRAMGISEQQQQVALDREARDRQIAEAIRMRQQPLSELSALMTGTTPFTQVAAQGPAPVGAVSGPAPVDLGAITSMQQADALARYQGAQQRQSTMLGLGATLGGSVLSNPGLFD
jgi:signal transduction histidine kinase